MPKRSDTYDEYDLRDLPTLHDTENDQENSYDVSGSFDDTISANSQNGASKRRYKMVKKALSLFAHWKPSLYNNDEENSVPSDVVSAVARGHSRPLGGPLRWGRR